MGACRGLLAKRLMDGSAGKKGMHPLNVQALDSMLALMLTFPFAVSVDGPRLAADSLAIHPVRLAFLLAAVGVTYFLFNFAALKLLEKLDVISHAVCNLGKRIFVIGTSIAFFNNP